VDWQVAAWIALALTVLAVGAWEPSAQPPADPERAAFTSARGY
jgi:hypothetical protein